MNKILAIALPIGLAFSLGCSHNIKKSKFSKTTTSKEMVSDLKEKLNEAYTAQADILASEDFSEGKKLYLEAKQELKEKNKDHQEIRKLSEYSKAYLERAINKSSERQPTFSAIISARNAAKSAGVMQYSDLSNEIKDVDREVKSFSANFAKDLSAKEYAHIQKRYLGLEVKAIQRLELERTHELLTKAENQDAKEKAPKALKTAKVDINTANNLIAKSPRDSVQYASAVNRAILSTLFLTDVMSVIQSRGGDVKESLATEIVRKDRKLGQKDTRITELRGHLDRAHGTIDGLDAVLDVRDVQLDEAHEKISFQQAMNQVRNEFSKDEAEVYQQGDNLIIRLKQINFAVGKHNVPEDSEAILKKIERIVAKLSPAELVIQGHTDSTGDASYNVSLSKKRAKSVAQFFEDNAFIGHVNTKGYGESRPLAANDSKIGREMNRRVDIVVKTRN